MGNGLRGLEERGRDRVGTHNNHRSDAKVNIKTYSSRKSMSDQR